ncbi:TetR/AcrR family transcriptional regulator [Catenulispora sp. NF23]|uniref:TetR/AcrR family transcriptional regulator n=1 Tax=Catenulispora pinistramenti TaxID=2705254 RepID=A0ABS5KTJ7_9ACTN|nr:TetR/AcrR family transcriptional regulator [Catenulispora pinistramenti]MBS2533073.1 TetR/AcrR family transcriptional regulator [Catenulispora pinistramenti]MBS2549388.1 TetR/AcrR family transcriptional regulator [Catenulispora pinistramenti]
MAQGVLPNPSATRARILDTATSLFYERGVHAVGVNEIAAAAGASKLSLYRYFPSKAELVRAMLTEHSDRIHAWLARKTALAAASGPDRVLAVFDVLTEWFAQPGYHGCAIVNGVTDTRADPEVAAIARAHLHRYLDLLEDLLAGLAVADPETLARQLLLLIEGASVVVTIEGTTDAGADARKAAAALLRAATPAS